jgi:hypothetical protein
MERSGRAALQVRDEILKPVSTGAFLSLLNAFPALCLRMWRLRCCGASRYGRANRPTQIDNAQAAMTAVSARKSAAERDG